ncbi:glycosyltransferase family 39 protein [Kineococcus sp. TBRC 1896]|uniref:Glycosyltransferase family 39 protein n=1 Tax=Kineococcus mangrovi TaxID=1660183 RepID=A0ABV4HW67_9ACTN
MSAPAVATAVGTAPRGRPREAVLLPLVGLASTLVVLLGAWRPSLWTDEAATLSAAQRSPAQLWRMLQHLDAVHGLYYAAMHVWTGLAGTSPLALRLPSAVAVGLGAVGVLVLARRLTGNPSTALLAAAAFTLLPRTAWSGTEARSTAAATALAVWCTVLLARALAAPSGPPARRWWAGYALVAATGVVLDVYLLLLLAAHAVTVCLLREVPTRRRRPWPVAAGAALALASPVVVLAGGQGGQLGGSSPGPVTLLRRVAVDQFFLGETPTAGSGATAGWSWWQPAALALAALGWALVVLALARPGAPGGALARWCLPWLLLPSGLVALAALAAPAAAGPLHNPRYFAFCAPALAVLLARALSVLPRRRRVLVGGLAVLLALPVLVSQRTAHAKSASDWAQVAEHLCRDASPGDAVYFGARRPPVGGQVGLTTRGVSVAYPRCFERLDDLTLTRTPAAAGDLTGRSRPLAAAGAALAAHDTVWVVRRPTDATVAADDETLADAGFTVRGRWSGPLDEVVEFTRR